MSTTTIRLPDKLKTRVARAAARAGMNPHGFMLEAIADKAQAQELRDAFEAQAEERYAKLVASGKSIGWDQMREYLEKRAAGQSPRRPVSRKLAR